jgi:hypothetical protein
MNSTKTGFLHQDLACVALNQMIGGEDWHVESGSCFSRQPEKGLISISPLSLEV